MRVGAGVSTNRRSPTESTDSAVRNYDIIVAYLGIMKMQGRNKVYVETSVVSYLTAKPSHDLIKNARQLVTQDWWQVASDDLDLFISPLVEREASKGDAEAASKRISALDGISRIPVTEEMLSLAEKLLEATAVPRTSFDDAVHIAVAAVSGMDFLVSWNCKHIANPATKPLIRKTLERLGFDYPEICTPLDMKGDD